MLVNSHKNSPEILETLPLLPLRDIVVFPHMIVPFVVGRQNSIKALDHALLHGGRIFLAAQKDASVDIPTSEEIYRVGTISNVIQNQKLSSGNMKVLVEGIERAQVVDLKIKKGSFTEVIIRPLPITVELNPEMEDLMQEAVALFEKYIKLSRNITYEALVSTIRVDNPSRLADTIAAHTMVKVKEKQQLLETLDPKEQLEKLIELLEIEISKLRVDRRVNEQVKKQMEKAQKEYYLNEKLKAIQKELNRKDGKQNEIQAFRERVDKTKLSKEANKKAQEELERLEAMPPMSAEATVSRNYLEWLLSAPWGVKSRENRDIKRAARILDEDHYGLEKIKERIIEYLAVRQLVKSIKGSILCFVGAAGVGKSSLASSIARATGRKFVRLSLGGVRDEAEIRGHRRTYIGAFPGQIIQMMKKASTINPVFLLDEVDKMSMDFRGDPSAALMEVLDPEQNKGFVDHYLDVAYDLSQVMFIATANVLHTIPPALRDRMEVLRLPGYTLQEKLQIAKKFLLKKQLKAHGLTKKKIEFTDEAIVNIIEKYTREAGVRNLEREIASICRKVAKKVIADNQQSFTIATTKDVEEYLGVPKYHRPKSEKKNEAGLAFGVAWTEMGGEILPTESTIMSGRGKLILTGQLGGVMQESAQAGLSYIRSNAAKLGIDPNFYRKVDIHIHIPEGSIPKDGPSAGITMVISLISALTDIPVRSDVAMTGEITLRGKVLPVGGLKEKVLAAHRSEIYNIVIPKENQKELAEIPAEIKKSLKIYLVETIEEALPLALERPVSPLKGEIKALLKRGVVESQVSPPTLTN
ncbi:MAG: endopeptidase La [Candidatus Aminicenantes bacterium]|nr:endopeptidase La [Candidatus Aminicenantes bacterium]MDH5714432.1 endopeptidase La [Candidatus Aminicenantes bacterium]